MAISANTVAASDTLEKLRQEFNNLQSDVDTLNTSGISAASYIFEGATVDDFETTLAAIDPTADHTVSLPNATTTLVGQDSTDTLTNKTLTAPTINGVVGGTQTSATITTLNGTTLNAGTLAVAAASITDSSGAISFGNENLTTTGGIKVGDDGTIGSATSADAMTIASTGIVTFKDDILLKNDGTIGSAGAATAMTIDSSGIVAFIDDIKIKDVGTIGSASAPAAMTIAADGIVTFVDDIKIKDTGTIGSATTPNAIAIAANGDVTFANSSFSSQGKNTMWIPAAAMRPQATNGCEIIQSIDLGTNDNPDMQVLDFDSGATNEHAQFGVAFPKSWNIGTITYQVYWTSSTASADTVLWNLQGVAVSNSDTVVASYGSAVQQTDDYVSGATVNLLCISAESSAVTIGGSPADDDFCFLRIFRNSADAGDDLLNDARLIGIRLFYTTDAGNDD